MFEMRIHSGTVRSKAANSEDVTIDVRTREMASFPVNCFQVVTHS